MTRDDIIRMAREAGLEHFPDNWGDGWWHANKLEILERFAALVAAAEQEKVARWQIGSGYTTGHGDTIEDLLTELEWQVRESEREACAGLCQWKTGVRPVDAAIETCAAAIRARGETE